MTEFQIVQISMVPAELERQISEIGGYVLYRYSDPREHREYVTCQITAARCQGPDTYETPKGERFVTSLGTFRRVGG